MCLARETVIVAKARGASRRDQRARAYASEILWPSS